MPSPAIEPGDVRTSKLQRCLPGALSLASWGGGSHGAANTVGATLV